MLSFSCEKMPLYSSLDVMYFVLSTFNILWYISSFTHSDLSLRVCSLNGWTFMKEILKFLSFASATFACVGTQVESIFLAWSRYLSMLCVWCVCRPCMNSHLSSNLILSEWMWLPMWHIVHQSSLWSGLYKQVLTPCMNQSHPFWVFTSLMVTLLFFATNILISYKPWYCKNHVFCKINFENP